MELIDRDLLAGFDVDAFRRTRPYPWFGFEGFLRAGAFERLCAEFPALELFEMHEGIEREHGQRPHDRYYLAYESSVYHAQDVAPKRGVVGRAQLSPAWRSFIDEIESEEYRGFVERVFGVSRFRLRYAWHVGITGSSVSPHLDGRSKLGTHIFYFDRPDEWDAAWGGETLVLGDPRVDRMNPDFDDFEVEIPSSAVGNRSFLFRNAPNAWHGVRPLTCPPGAQRRLFNVILLWKRSKTSKLAKRLGAFLGR